MKKSIARFLLRVGGWTIHGDRPKVKRYVLIAAPHTSNWDFPLLLLFAAAFDIDIRWMGKQALFTPPVGWIMRALGGMPIDRSKSNNMVDAMVDAFGDNYQLSLVIPTEGTRSRSSYWKSGFYHIARQARVPVVPTYLDYARKRGCIGAPFQLSGDMRGDMDHLRHFYFGIQGKHPEQSGPIRLAGEDEVPP